MTRRASPRAVAIVVCALFASLLGSGAAAAGVYRSQGHAFSVTLPDGWQRLDPAVFARFKAAALAKGRGVEAVEACFRVREDGVDQPAALVLLYHDFPNESLAELAATDEKEMIAMADAVKIAYRYGTPPKDGITDVDISYPTVTDAQRHLVRSEFVAEYFGKVRIHGLVFHKPGREGVVTLGFLVEQAGYGAQRPALEAIAKSLAFFPGHELQPGKQEANIARSDTKAYALGCVSFLLFLAWFPITAWMRHRS